MSIQFHKFRARQRESQGRSLLGRSTVHMSAVAAVGKGPCTRRPLHTEMALKEGGLKWKVVLSVFLWRALYIPNMMFLGNKRCNRKYYIFYLNISSQRGREFLEVLLGIPPVWRGATMKSEKRVQLPSPTLIVHMTKIKILMQAHCILTDKTKSCKSVNINLVFMYST